MTAPSQAGGLTKLTSVGSASSPEQRRDRSLLATLLQTAHIRGIGASFRFEYEIRPPILRGRFQSRSGRYSIRISVNHQLGASRARSGLRCWGHFVSSAWAAAGRSFASSYSQAETDPRLRPIPG
jgi:hypothetical protein